MRDKIAWTTLAVVAIGGIRAVPAAGQSSSPPVSWTPLAQAIQTTIDQGIPLVVMVTSRSAPSSIAFRDALTRSPQFSALAQKIRFAEMPVEDYRSQVEKLGIGSFPTFIAYTRGNDGLKPLGMRGGFSDVGQVLTWLEPLGRPNTASESMPKIPARLDPLIARTSHPQASGQAIPSEQQYSPPPAPPKSTPVAPPVYPPPPPQQQQQYYQTAPQQYVPAPAPNYIQTQTPAMIVQQAPQQIILAPPSPPQITVAMAAPMYAPAPAPMNAPTANIFTQPMQAPTSQPMQAPTSQPMQAPTSQPMQAPMSQPMQAPPMQAPPMQAPQQVGQAPSTAMVLQAPGLVNSMIGTLGEYMARRKNPRIQMSPMPTLAQAPVANAPMGFAPAGYGQAPAGYASVTGYAPYGPPIAVMTPESTSFAPCNTYNAPCRYHGGPCPGPGGNGGGGYVPPPPYPSASPQDPRYNHQGSSGGHGLRSWFHRN